MQSSAVYYIEDSSRNNGIVVIDGTALICPAYQARVILDDYTRTTGKTAQRVSRNAAKQAFDNSPRKKIIGARI